MVELIIMEKKYDNNVAIGNVINYIHNSINRMYSVAMGTTGDTVEDTIHSFERTQKMWGKANGKRIHHLVMSFEKSKEPTLEQLKYITYCVTEYFSQVKKFQIFSGAHIEQVYNKDNKHIHFAINPINYVNGCRFQNRREDYIELFRYLAENCDVKVDFKIIYKPCD